MSTKLYVGNLSYQVSDDELKSFFSKAGEVLSARIVRDRETGRSKGFGFVEMSSSEGAEGALQSLNGQELSGRALRVSPAKEDTGGGRGPRPGGPRRPGGGGGFNRGPRNFNRE